MVRDTRKAANIPAPWPLRLGKHSDNVPLIFAVIY